MDIIEFKISCSKYLDEFGLSDDVLKNPDKLVQKLFELKKEIDSFGEKKEKREVYLPSRNSIMTWGDELALLKRTIIETVLYKDGQKVDDKKLKERYNAIKFIFSRLMILYEKTKGNKDDNKTNEVEKTGTIKGSFARNELQEFINSLMRENKNGFARKLSRIIKDNRKSAITLSALDELFPIAKENKPANISDINKQSFLKTLQKMILDDKINQTELDKILRNN
jgi:hypothetical protein